MNLTYFVMIEMLEANHASRGKVIGQLSDHVNMEDFLSSDNPDTNRLFFNENAAKGVSDYLREHGESEKLSASIVGIPEDLSIFEYEDAQIEDFKDVINIYPDTDERYDALTGEFLRSSESLESDHAEVEKGAIVFEKASQIIKDLPTDESQIAENEDADLDERRIRALLPTRETLNEMINSSLGISDDNTLCSLMITNAEATLATFQTLMSDNLEDVEDLDVDSINQRIFTKVASTETAKDYLQAERIVDGFVENTKEQESILRSQYEVDLQNYLAEVVKEAEARYRAEVPDQTEEIVSEYYNQLAPMFQQHKDNREVAEDRLKELIVKEFISADRSPAMKSLRKFVVLKDQLRQSTISSILSIKSNEANKAYALSHSEEQPVAQYDRPDLDMDADIERKDYEESNEFLEDNQELHEDYNYEDEPHENFENEDHLEDNFYDENEDYEGYEGYEEDQEDEDLNEEDQEDLDHENEDQENMEIDQKVDVSAVNLEDLMNDDDSKEDVVKDEEDIESAEEDKPSKKKSKRNKKKKKKGLAAKIGLGFGATALAAVVTFGTISYFKGGKPSSQNSTEQSANQGAQSKTIGDAVFNVGDTLTIAGQDGKFLDVKIKEFKDDGSAVATDANGDLWLITADQMKQYADKHPELFKKDKKDENKSTESKQENQSDANATSDKKDESKKDESKKDESKKDESKKDESKKDESKSNKKDESKSGN